jgi:hypothetical protein
VGRTLSFVYGVVVYPVFLLTFLYVIDFFGLRQLYLHRQGSEYTHLPFTTMAFYKFVRHPPKLWRALTREP